MLVKKDNAKASVYILVTGKLKKSIHAPWNSYKVNQLLLKSYLGRRRQKGLRHYKLKT